MSNFAVAIVKGLRPKNVPQEEEVISIYNESIISIF